jgi:oxygen-dependent protoporphyrinogen oxidase
MSQTMRLAIVGGGIAGLSAAYRAELLRRAGKIQYTMFEAASHLGGVIRTEIVDGCVVEGGPDSFLTEKPAAALLARELGLGAELIASNDAQRATAIVVRGRRVPLPDGLMFMVPTRIAPVATSSLFSWGTKLRFAREWLAGPAGRAPEGDESVGGFVRRHFGQEVVDRLADPLLSGIYGGDVERLSARAVLPRMVEMEAKHDSLTRAMLAAKAKGEKQKEKGKNESRPPLFTSLRGGMQQLVDAAVAQLDADSVQLNTRVVSLAKAGPQWEIATEDARAGQQQARMGPRSDWFDGVVVALPAYAASELLTGVDAELAQDLGAIPYSSSITAVLGYVGSLIGEARLDGFGFLVPRSEGRLMLACTYVHQKFPQRAPAGRALLRCFIGGANAERAFAMRDDEILRALRQELREIVGVDGAPLFTRVFRWPRAMAQYEVGHTARLERIEARRRALPGLALAGNAYRGIGVPDCVASGAAAVATALEAADERG